MKKAFKTQLEGQASSKLKIVPNIVDITRAIFDEIYQKESLDKEKNDTLKLTENLSEDIVQLDINKENNSPLMGRNLFPAKSSGNNFLNTTFLYSNIFTSCLL